MRKWLIILATLTIGYGQSYQFEIHQKSGEIVSFSVESIREICFLDSSALGHVRLKEPAAGQTRLPLTPRLQWSAIDTCRYQLQVAQDSLFGQMVLDVSPIDTNIYRVDTPLELATRYFWRVRALPDLPWSEIWQFTTYSPFPPLAVQCWAVWSGAQGALLLDYELPENADEIMACWGTDGARFADTVLLDPEQPEISGLPADSLIFVQLRARNAGGVSDASDVLAALPALREKTALIVNGFDRPTSGNTYDFVRQHAGALVSGEWGIASCSNEAARYGLVQLLDYDFVDYILGEESTADETFGSNEQDLIKSYLQEGGKLFVSGSELAWDLSNKGSTADKTFCHKYLKVRYADDAPNNQPNNTYSAEPLSGGIFGGLSTIRFDNGNHGTYNVSWPDVFQTKNGSIGFLAYSGLATSNGFAGVCSEGIVEGGSAVSKAVVLGFPFETIYPDSMRTEVMQKVIAFFEQPFTAMGGESLAIPGQYRLFQNYPNPFNPLTTIRYQLPQPEFVTLRIIDLLGQDVRTLVRQEQPAGDYRIMLNASGLASGTYLYELRAGDFTERKKLCLLK